jgi:hypothetical protein
VGVVEARRGLEKVVNEERPGRPVPCEGCIAYFVTPPTPNDPYRYTHTQKKIVFFLVMRDLLDGCARE